MRLKRICAFLILLIVAGVMLQNDRQNRLTLWQARVEKHKPADANSTNEEPIQASEDKLPVKGFEDEGGHPSGTEHLGNDSGKDLQGLASIRRPAPVVIEPLSEAGFLVEAKAFSFAAGPCKSCEGRRDFASGGHPPASGSGAGLQKSGARAGSAAQDQGSARHRPSGRQASTTVPLWEDQRRSPSAAGKAKLQLTKLPEVSAEDLIRSQNFSVKFLRQAHGPALVVRNKELTLLDVDLDECKPQRKQQKGISWHSWKILSVEETARFLQQGGSISRFGDGEWKLQSKVKRGSINKGMEVGSEKLRDKLQAIPRLGDATNLSVRVQGRAVPLCVGMVPIMDDETLDLGESRFKSFHVGWRHKFFHEDHSDQFFPPGTYCSTSITRPDHRIDLKPLWWLQSWIEIMRDKRVLYVGPRDVIEMGPTFDVFELIFRCAAGVAHYYIPERRAFQEHDRVLADIVRLWHHHKIDLVAATAGPLGTVLGAELPCIGISAIDSGHIYKKLKQFIWDNNALNLC